MDSNSHTIVDGPNVSVSDHGVPKQMPIQQHPKLDELKQKLKLKLSEFRENNHTRIPVANSPGKSLSEASALELCCGSANLSAALRLHHVNAIGVDYGRNPQTPKAPTIQADISSPQGQKIVDQAEEDMHADIVHAAPPCGTASKARDKPIPLRFRLKGAPCPRPLRSPDFPRGIPHGLTEIEQLRVDTANQIYDYVLAKCHNRHLTNKLFSLENPSTSYFWMLPEAISLMHLPGVYVIDFQQCAHGGDRPVWRRWVTNIHGMLELVASCPGVSNSHVHSAFGINKSLDGWKFDTASEATYPPLLCRRVSRIYVSALLLRGYSPAPTSLEDDIVEPNTKRQYTRATLGKFVRGNRLPQLISEFSCKTKCQVPLTVTEGQTIKHEDAYAKVLGFDGEPTGALLTAQIGIFRTPAQFIDAADRLRHPVDLPSFLPDGLLENVFWLLTTPNDQVARSRLEKLRQMKQWSLELRSENDKILQCLQSDQRNVLQNKHLALFDKVLREIGYKDTDLVKHLIEGTVLVGNVHKSGVFPHRYKPASLATEDLFKAAKVTRRSVIDNVRGSGDIEIDKAVWDDTLSEVERGWLSKQMTEDDVASAVGDDFVVARRFGIKQSGKIRSIDDYSEPQTNQTNGTQEKIDLLGTDEFFVLLQLVAASVAEDGSVNVELSDGRILSGRIPPGTTTTAARSWLGKTFDLKSAYRQLATSRDPLNSKAAIICVFDPENRRPAFFLQYATPFGSISSVYMFNRAARGLWAVGIWLGFAWTNYFDDYPMAEPASSSDSADLTVRSLFALLGWNLALEPKKNKPFSKRFPMLGIIANLEPLSNRCAVYENKEERISDLTHTLDDIISSGKCPAPLMAEVKGKAQFAAAQTAGRLAAGPLHIMSLHHFHTKSGHMNQATISAIKRLREILSCSPPRTLHFSGEVRPILVFTDGACEGVLRQIVTIGAVIIDTAKKLSEMWGGHVCPELVRQWQDEGKTQVIGQAELLPTAMVRLSNNEMFRHRRVIFFIDNDSARQALIKGWSPSVSSSHIVQLMVDAEVGSQTWTWYSRVPTKSNPADDPSRLVFVSGPDNRYARTIPMPDIPKSLYR